MTTPSSTSPTAADLPVTVSITRHVEVAYADQMLAWIQAGVTLAERFPGFLGAGWVRPGTSSDEWHCLYRFDSSASLDAWEASSQRRWWLDAGQDLVDVGRIEQRTGIEGWFDEPVQHDVRDLRSPAPASAPPRWKQGVMIWFAFFPLSLLVSAIFGLVAPDLSLVPRVLISTVLMTPVMTYLVLPQLTRRLDWWLRGEQPPWRSPVS